MTLDTEAVEAQVVPDNAREFRAPGLLDRSGQVGVCGVVRDSDVAAGDAGLGSSRGDDSSSGSRSSLGRNSSWHSEEISSSSGDSSLEREGKVRW